MHMITLQYQHAMLLNSAVGMVSALLVSDIAMDDRTVLMAAMKTHAVGVLLLY